MHGEKNIASNCYLLQVHLEVVIFLKYGAQELGRFLTTFGGLILGGQSQNASLKHSISMLSIWKCIWRWWLFSNDRAQEFGRLCEGLLWV